MGVVCSAPTWVVNAPVNAIENGAAHKSACDGGEHASEREAQGLYDGTLWAADELTIPPVRTLGFRPQNPRNTPPICSICDSAPADRVGRRQQSN